MRCLETGPGFTRYRLGELSIVALRDGYVDMPPSRLRREANGQPFGADLPPAIPLVDGSLRLSVNAFLVESGRERLLIDTGAGTSWEPSMGRLLQTLAAAGISRDEIESVALTHTHTDHIGGLLAPDGGEAFPRLERLFVPREEMASSSAKERLAAFLGRCATFEEGSEIATGVVARAAHGHARGHSVFEVSSGGQTLLVWGDLVHVPSIQFARPELTWEFDADQARARDARLDFLHRAAQPGVFVAGAHLDSPGVGAVEKAGEAYRFTPIQL